MAIARTVAVQQGKGGVGKTSVTANVAGLAAASGAKALIIDLDPQGNIARELGYEQNSGRDLFMSLQLMEPLPVMKDVRPNLDVIPAGDMLRDASALESNWLREDPNDTVGARLHKLLEPIAGEYDIILIDTPPGDRSLSEGALTIATSVVIPTKLDDSSLDGVELVAKRFASAASRNPYLRLAGVVLFAVNPQATRMIADTRADLEDILGGSAPVFNASIRHLESAAVSARKRGLLVHELETATVAAKKDLFESLRLKKKPKNDIYVRNASGLADDYTNLTQELLVRVAELESEQTVGEKSNVSE